MKICFNLDFQMGRSKDASVSIDSNRQLLAECMRFVEKARGQGRYSTADNYETALHSLLLFAQTKRLMPHAVCLRHLTPDFLKQYVLWLERRGVKRNTQAVYLRTLRGLLHLVAPGQGKDLFNGLFTGAVPTRKRSLTPQEVTQIAQYPIPDGHPLQLVRDLFLFSFYCQGMPFVDMSALTQDNLHDGVLVYHRRKTGKEVVVPLSEQALRIIRKYQIAEPSCCNAPLFPLFHPGETRCERTRYSHQLRSYNRRLLRLGQLVGIEQRLTSYVSRHTWASIAYQANVEINVIASAMGHTNPHTTLLYIRDIDHQRLRQASMRVISFVEELGGRT